VLECVVNIAEGRDESVLGRLRASCGGALLDIHADPWHHRSVFTLRGEDAPRHLATTAVALLDLRRHEGVHPRIGVVDVVPFVPLGGSTMSDAQRARDDFAGWLTATHGVPCLVYGPERTLPEVRRLAASEVGHPTAGVCAVGARDVLVAYNLWVEADLETAQRVAAAVRGDGIRALGLPVGERVQVSMNLVDPHRVGPAEAWDRVAGLVPVAGAELVGLVPDAVLRAVPEDRWSPLDLSIDQTIEARLATVDELRN
jgi:glutamate formiminotransferase / 5-formyltetrahydrofolate cyclo-ligase